MMDNMLTGDAEARQRAEGHVMAQTAQQQANMAAMEHQFDAMLKQEMMQQ